ncbi:MAG: Bax inhibitor-1/YccA family protein [Erythrobacter sp.]
MAEWNEQQRPQQQDFTGASVPRTGEVFDEGLRKHMLSIYNYMSSGVLLTGIVALLTFSTGMAASFTSGPLYWLVALSPLAVVILMSFGRNKFSKATLQMMFWGFALLMGLSLSTLFYYYTQGSIAVTFFATAGAFAGLSLWGYTTKRDISGWGSFLFIGLIGLILSSLLNLWLQSPVMHYAVGAIGVLIFAGLTAYDTQRLKHEYSVYRGTEYAGKAIILGALSLYLDFINMFLFLLRFMGSRE